MNICDPFGKDIWIVDGDVVRMYGVLPFTTRMTVVRLGSGNLWLHSPVKPAPEILSAVNALGPVKYLVAPNKIHSLGISPWKAKHPVADVWGSPQFNQRHPDISLDGVLADDGVNPWEGEIARQTIDGHSFLDEVVFLHKASATLIVTDLIQKHERSKQTWFWKIVKGLVGVLGRKGGVPRDVQWSFHDRKAARQSLEEILDWEFDNLIVSHGICLKGGAKKDVERCFSHLLG